MPDLRGAYLCRRGALFYNRHMPRRFELNPREVDQVVVLLHPRRELVYRLAIRGLCTRCRVDRAFTTRTHALLERHLDELAELLSEAKALAAELTG